MTQDLPQLSPLAQRLQQRSLASAGVINLHPSSIDRTNTTIHRMVQRELLPHQIESRYQTAGVISSLELTGRSRVETLDRVAPQMDTFLPSSILQRSPNLISGDIALTPNWNTSPVATISPPSTNTFRVSRKPTSEVVAIPVVNKAIDINAATTATVTESTTSQEQMRVQHSSNTLLQADGSATSLLMAKPSISSPINSTSPTNTTPISDQLSPQIGAPSILPSDQVSPSVSSLPMPSISDTTNSQLTLLARFPIAENASTSAADLGKSGATSDTPIVRVESGGILPSPTEPMTIAANSQPLVIAKFPIAPRSIGEKNILQTKGLTYVQTPAAMPPSLPQTTVMIQPLSQKQFESAGSSVLRRQPASESPSRLLPLHTRIPINTIVRQTEPMGESISVPTDAMPPPPVNKSPTGLEPDLKQITDRVSRLLTQQLIVERERRGIQKW
jgi:hypothetical protein